MVNTSLSRLLCGLFLGLLLTACTDFTPAWQLDRLRILAISSNPAALQPGESARLSALVVDEPQNRPLTFFWLGCAPDPFNLNREACSNEEFLKEPSLFLSVFSEDAEEDTSEGMDIQFLGMGRTSEEYYVPKALFSMLPEEHPQRKIGTFGTILLLVVAEALPENPSYEDIVALVQRAQDKRVASQIALFRIPVRESDGPPNQNPIVSQLLLNGVPQPKSALMFLERNQTYDLDIVVPPESFEAYVEITPTGVSSKTELLFAFLFSTCGELKDDKFNFATSIRPKLLTPNGKGIQDCSSPIQQLFAVVRDSRSGQTWHQQSFLVCQNNGPSPLLRRAEVKAHVLTLEGESLEALAEVRLAGQFLWPLPAPQNGLMEVLLPQPLEPGTYTLSFTDFSCRAQTFGELSF